MSAEKPVILITGVAKRLGLALAHHFLDRDWCVVCTYRSERDSLNALREKGIELIQCDFEQHAAVSECIASIKGRHAAVRAIIHNASDWASEDGTAKDSELFDRMMMVHAKAPYLINFGLKECLEKSGDADIIHVTDYVTQRGSKKHPAYAASKAALENLTLSFASAFAPNIKVNNVSPALLKFNEGDGEEYKAKALKKATLPWEGGFEEAVNAVDYLLDSNYITGRTIHLDGGRHLK
jgi:dihydromonapterin reductase/dihydrofolate reductase